MNRRDFLRISTPVIALLANGQIVRATEGILEDWKKKKLVLRFAIASDGHYGQPNTAYQQYSNDLVERINSVHGKTPFDFTIINGDIIHDDNKFFPEIKSILDKLTMKYYVSQGNHDHIDAAGWESIWKMPTNLSFSIKKNSFLIGTTSDESGKYLCPDISWFERELEKHRSQKNIFIFIHINPAKLTPNAVDCTEWTELLKTYSNIRAVFNGHDHDHDGVKVHEGMNYIFDAHFGGNWGTSYRGFRVVELYSDNTIMSYILDPVNKINEVSLRPVSGVREA
jgi:Calcineurin-like phosphoesterase